MNKSRHCIFLGSSSESKWLAREIEGLLNDFGTIEIDAWYHFGSWPAGKSTLESLEDRLRVCDFAVFVLSEDDWTQSRSDAPRPAPRDNVLFELGLFMGKLGRDRSFFFFPATTDFKMPSDLFGITALPYAIPDRDKAASLLSPLCTRIAKQIVAVDQESRAKGMLECPKLRVNVMFPADQGRRVDNLKYLPAFSGSAIKITVRSDDETVTGVKVYFSPKLNLRKSTWSYAEDGDGRHFWISEQQITQMKKEGCTIGFEVDRPHPGTHEVRVVAECPNQVKYEKVFCVNVCRTSL